MRLRLRLVGFMCVSAAVAGAAVSVAEAKVQPIATLLPSQVNVTFTGIAEAGGVIVAGGEGTAEVFAASRSGWTTGRAAAVLTGADLPLMSVATSGNVVVASSGTGATGEDPEVFVKPASGWSGSVSPVARLVTSTGATLPDAAVAGRIIVAGGSDGALYVFTQPVGGWSGAVTEAARLADSTGALVSDPAIVGGEVLAQRGIDRRIDVFTEPATGWSGVVAQSGAIADQRPPFVASGGDVLGTINPLSFGVNYDSLPITAVFSVPSAGWNKPLRLLARLYSATTKDLPGAHVFSGTVAAASTVEYLGSADSCPCPTEVTVFTKPAGGWTGTIAARSVIAGSLSTLPHFNALALDGHMLFVAEVNKVMVYRVSGTEGVAAKPPRAARAIGTGLATGRPTLRFRIEVGTIDPHVTQFELRLPPGLSLATRQRELQRALGTDETAGTPLFAASVTNDHGRLLVRPLLPLPRAIDITIKAGGLRESRSLTRTTRRRLRRRRDVPLHGRLRTIDSVGAANTSPVLFLARR